MNEKMIQKGLAVCTAFVLVLCGLSGCGKKASTDSDGSSLTSQTSEYGDVTDNAGDITNGDDTITTSNSGLVNNNTDKTTGNKQSTTNKSGGSSKSDSSKVSGSIKVLVSEEKVEIETILPIFKKKYPNINVTLVPFSGNAQQTPSQLSIMSAAKTLPDVAMGVENFGYIMKQGLAYPLDKLYNADPDKDKAFKQGLTNYTYFGHLFALPYRLQFSCVLVNLDLLEKLNLPDPDYTWTIDEFVNLAKRATTSEYSGINYIVNIGDPTHGLDTSLMNGLLPATFHQYGYNLSTHLFNFTNGAWVNSKKIVKELESVPGLVSDNLKNVKGSGGKTAYEEKFGSSADALVSGKVLFGNHHSWEMTWMIDQFKFKWDMYPVPTGEGIPQRIQTHTDYVCLTTNVSQANRQAAYEFAKFLSYDKDAAIARMKYMEQSKAKTGSYTIILPASGDPEALAYFNSIKMIPKGIKYMLKTVMSDSNKVFIADCNKIVPNFWVDVTQYRSQVDKKISEGADPASLAKDLETKVNAAATSTWRSFEEKVKKDIEAFYKSHPYEK